MVKLSHLTTVDRSKDHFRSNCIRLNQIADLGNKMAIEVPDNGRSLSELIRVPNDEKYQKYGNIGNIWW